MTIPRFALVLLSMLLPLVATSAAAQDWKHNPFGIYRHLAGRATTLPDGRMRRWRWTRLGRITEETLDSRGHVSELAVIDLGKEGNLNRAEWNGGVPYFLQGVPLADGSVAWYSPRNKAPFRTTYDGRRVGMQEFPLSGGKGASWSLTTSSKDFAFQERQGDGIAEMLYPLIAAGMEELMNPPPGEPTDMKHAAAFAKALMASQSSPQGATEFWACEYLDPNQVYYYSVIGMKPKAGPSAQAESARKFRVGWLERMRERGFAPTDAQAPCEVLPTYAQWSTRQSQRRAGNPKILGNDTRSVQWGPNRVD